MILASRRPQSKRSIWLEKIKENLKMGPFFIIVISNGFSNDPGINPNPSAMRLKKIDGHSKIDIQAAPAFISPLRGGRKIIPIIGTNI